MFDFGIARMMGDPLAVAYVAFIYRDGSRQFFACHPRDGYKTWWSESLVWPLR